MEGIKISTISGDYQYKKIEGGIEIYKGDYETPWVTITEEALLDDYARLIETFSDIDILIENKDKIVKLIK